MRSLLRRVMTGFLVCASLFLCIMSINAKDQKVEQEKNVFVGIWSSYATKGIHSPSLSVYVFDSGGTYTKVTSIIPPADKVEEGQLISTTSYFTKGKYRINGKTVVLSTGGEESSWTFELNDNVLFLTTVDGDQVSISLLSRASGSLPTTPNQDNATK